jgi:hypothetical protein
MVVPTATANYGLLKLGKPRSDQRSAEPGAIAARAVPTKCPLLSIRIRLSLLENSAGLCKMQTQMGNGAGRIVQELLLLLP